MVGVLVEAPARGCYCQGFWGAKFVPVFAELSHPIVLDINVQNQNVVSGSGRNPCVETTGVEAGFLLAFVLSPSASWSLAVRLARELENELKCCFVGVVGFVVCVVLGCCFNP